MESGPIYADGGEDGEFITRAIVQGLPHFLEPQGRFYCGTMGVEREGEPFERRVRDWSGADQSALDILFIAEKMQGPAPFAYRAARNKKGDFERMDQWTAHMDKLKVKNLVKGLPVMQRKDPGRSGLTVRRQKAERPRAAEVEWLRNWETFWASPSRLEILLLSRPRIAPNVELHIVHTQRDAELSPSKFTLRSAYPFAVDYDCPE